MKPSLPDSWKQLAASPPLQQTTIHVVDDDALVRDALSRALGRYDCAVAMHQDAEAFLARFDGDEPQALVLDLGLPGMNGIQLLARLQATNASVPTLVLSSSDDTQSVVRAIQRGAIDFLPKPPTATQLEQAIARLLTLAPRFAIERRIAATIEQCLRMLTPREHDVYDLLLAGRTPKQIAAELGLQQRTAHIHCSNVLTKFRVETPNDLLLLRARLARGPLGPPLEGEA